jgi:hypothetical protein
MCVWMAHSWSLSALWTDYNLYLTLQVGEKIVGAP